MVERKVVPPRPWLGPEVPDPDDAWASAPPVELGDAGPANAFTHELPEDEELRPRRL